MKYFSKITVSVKNIHLFYLYLLNNDDLDDVYDDMQSLCYLRVTHKQGNRIAVLFKNDVSFDEAYNILKTYNTPMVPKGSPQGSAMVSDRV